MTTPGGTAGAAPAPAVPEPAAPGPELVVQVVRGQPDAEELAAVLAVLSATTAVASAGAGDRPAQPVAPQTWAAYWRGVRQPLHHGPDGWRASARPR